MSMFCFQCEQTVGCRLHGKGRRLRKQADTSNLQDALTGALVGLARAVEGKQPSAQTICAMLEGLYYNHQCQLRQRFNPKAYREGPQGKGVI